MLPIYSCIVSLYQMIDAPYAHIFVYKLYYSWCVRRDLLSKPPVAADIIRYNDFSIDNYPGFEGQVAYCNLAVKVTISYLIRLNCLARLFSISEIR